jgi:hypothetical protein
MKVQPFFLAYVITILFNFNVFAQSSTKSNSLIYKSVDSNVEIQFPQDYCSSNLTKLENLLPDILPSEFAYPLIKRFECEQPEVLYKDFIEKRVLTSSFRLTRLWVIKNPCNIENEDIYYSQHFNTSLDLDTENISTYFVKKNLFQSKSEKYFLFQNTPNPFEFQTIIEFSLPKDATVELIIKDIQGKVVFNSKDNYHSGLNKIEIIPKFLFFPCTYYYTMTTSDFTSTKKMIVIKN